MPEELAADEETLNSLKCDTMEDVIIWLNTDPKEYSKRVSEIREKYATKIKKLYLQNSKHIPYRLLLFQSDSTN